MTETVILHPDNHEPVAFTLAQLDWLPWLQPPVREALTERLSACSMSGWAPTRY